MYEHSPVTHIAVAENGHNFTWIIKCADRMYEYNLIYSVFCLFKNISITTEFQYIPLTNQGKTGI
jgi:hypothetical protein